MDNGRMDFSSWEMETDPLEIKEELNIKEEIDLIDEPTGFEYYGEINSHNEVQASTAEVLEPKEDYSDNMPLLERLKYLEKKNPITFNSKVIKLIPLNIRFASSESDIPIIANPAPTVLNIPVKKNKPCDCMKHVEYYCINCSRITVYQKERNHCATCRTLLKLQCKLCNKKYRVLSKVHPVLQINKLNNPLSKRKEVAATVVEGEIVDNRSRPVTGQRKKKTVAKILKNSASNLENHSSKNGQVSETDSKASEVEEIFCCPKCPFKHKRRGVLDVHVYTSHRFLTALNPDEDDDMYIELICLTCKLNLKKVSYEEKMKYFCTSGCKNPMVLKCILCPKTCSQLRNMRYHVRCNCYFRINKEKIKCAHCPYKTEAKSRLEYHIYMSHTPKVCPNCNYEFANNEALKRHLDSGCAPKLSYKPTSAESGNKQDFGDYVAGSEEPVNYYPRNFFKLPNRNDFLIVENKPEDVVRKIKPKLAKNFSIDNWSSDVDYCCLECGREEKKKFSKYRPWCKKCKIKYDYRCISCGKMYGSYTRIHKHVNNECHARLVYQCPFCEYTGSKKNLLSNHIKCRHTIYKCLECDNGIEGFLAFKKHITWSCLMESAYGEINYKKLISLYCKQCKELSDYHDVGALIECKKCSGNSSYQCLKCSTLFDNQDDMKKHVRECKPNFQCDSCEFVAYRKQDFDMHLKQKHIVRRCPDCGACFTIERTFQKHRLEELQKKIEKTKGPGGASCNVQYMSTK